MMILDHFSWFDAAIVSAVVAVVAMGLAGHNAT